MKIAPSARSRAAIVAAAVLSLAYLVLMFVVPPAPARVRGAMVEAARLMADAESALKACRQDRGLPIDAAADPNATGLVGVERSAITTSAGRLEAKRTTTNPAFAALVVSLLYEAGARRGDAVAVGASSSFPALVVASLAAAKALGLEPLVISSLGASEWGANVPSFTWLDMEECLRSKGLLDVRPIGRAIGGEEDIGRDMAPEGRALLAARLEAAGGPVLDAPNLERNVAERMALYREHAGGRPIKAFINIGGSWANMGTDPDVLKLEPGLNRRVIVPPPPHRGVIQAMAASGVPIIHLLNIKGLCERYGLSWDPRPLPRPGEGPPAGRSAGLTRRSLGLTVIYIALVLALLFAGRRRFPAP